MSFVKDPKRQISQFFLTLQILKTSNKIESTKGTKNVTRKEQEKLSSFEDFSPKAIMQDIIKFVYICASNI
jgi:hypothetical protein